MSRPGITLRTRLLLSHLTVVSIGVLVFLIASNRLSSVFVDNHLRSMGSMMSGSGQMATAEIEDAIRGEFNRALVWAAVISVVVAAVVASFAAARVLRPLAEIRRVAQRLGTGSYTERVPLPREPELAELAADVNALAEALQETEQRRLQLVAEVAHELRTPVATLKGYMEGLLDGVFSPDEETLAAAIRETTRIERLASDLGTLSRTEEGRIDLKKTSSDLSILADEVAERLRPQFDDNGVELVVEPGPSCPVSVDRDRIIQVLTNLVGNALAYTPSGGRVAIRSRIADNLAITEVSDDGRGLGEDQLSLVFERFYRADRGAAGGTGIGLTIARGLARLHGGDIAVESAGLGRGATFALTLPLDSTSGRPTREPGSGAGVGPA